jgi:hypothetical protein
MKILMQLIGIFAPITYAQITTINHSSIAIVPSVKRFHLSFYYIVYLMLILCRARPNIWINKQTKQKKYLYFFYILSVLHLFVWFVCLFVRSVTCVQCYLCLSPFFIALSVFSNVYLLNTIMRF